MNEPIGMRCQGCSNHNLAFDIAMEPDAEQEQREPPYTCPLCGHDHHIHPAHRYMVDDIPQLADYQLEAWISHSDYDRASDLIDERGDDQ